MAAIGTPVVCNTRKSTDLSTSSAPCSSSLTRVHLRPRSAGWHCNGVRFTQIQPFYKARFSFCPSVSTFFHGPGGRLLPSTSVAVVHVTAPDGAVWDFRVNTPTELVLSRLRMLHGAGNLLDSEGFSVVDERVCAGDYVYRAIQAVRARITAAAVQDILTTFWARVEGNMDRMPRREDFKAKYPLTEKEICCIPVSRSPGCNQPSLLWEGLNQPFASSEEILEVVELASPDVVILSGVSGAGKTRSLYEIAVRQPCVFLAGAPEDSTVVEGSRDLLEVRDALERIYPQGSEIRIDALASCLRVVLLVRFFVYYSAKVDNVTFLFQQVMHRHLNYPSEDPWAFLTETILGLAKTHEELEELDEQVATLLQRYPWEGPFILDECQELVRYLPNRFVSGGGLLNRCMLDRFALALRHAGFNNTIYISGTTGRSLYRMSGHETGTMKLRVSTFWYTNFGGFEEETLKAFAARLLRDCTILDIKRLRVLYSGRHRAFATALECCILANPPSVEVNEWLMNLGMDFAMKRGARWLARRDLVDPRDVLVTVNQTILDDVYRFFEGVPSREVEEAKLLVQAVVMNMFFGRGRMVVLNPTLSLVEFGLARLVYKGQRQQRVMRVQWMCDGEAGLVGDPSDGEENRRVEIAEPLVLMALWRYYQTECSVKHMRQPYSEMDRSSRGKASVMEMVGLHLDGRSLSDHFSSWNGAIPEVYKKTARLVRPQLELETPFGVESESFRLLDWIESVQTRQEFFYTFFWTSEIVHCGPDIWFFLSLGDGDDETEVLCAAQVKTSKNMTKGDCVDAKDALDFEQLFLHGSPEKIHNVKDAEAAKLVKDFPHYLKLIVTTDYVDLQRFSTAATPPRPMKRRKTSHDEGPQGLLGVLDASSTYLFVESWLLKSVRECME